MSFVAQDPRVGQPDPLRAADRLHRLGAGRRLRDRDRVRGLRRRRLARARRVEPQSLTWKNFWEGLMGTTRTSCMIMFILAGASFLTKTMAFTGIPRELAEWVDAMHLLAPTR